MTDDEVGSAEHSRSIRLSAQEVRRRMLDAALVTVRENGMTLDFRDLQLDKVIVAAGVPRSSAYRIWKSRESFVGDLLNESASIFADHLSDNRSLRLAIDLVASRPDLHHSEEGRRRLTLELVRVVLEQNYYSTIDSIAWQSFLAMSAALLADDDNDSLRLVSQTLRQASGRFVDEMAAFHEAMARLLGYRLRSGLAGGFTLYAVLGSSIVEGLAVRHLSNPAVTDNFYLGRPTLTDEPVEWAPSSIGFLAIYDAFLEPDPDFDSSTIEPYLAELTIAARADTADEPGAAE
jgi:AcrR family transcriptional regulator